MVQWLHFADRLLPYWDFLTFSNLLFTKLLREIISSNKRLKMEVKGSSESGCSTFLLFLSSASETFSCVKRSQQSPNVWDFVGVFTLEGLGEKILFESTVNKLSVSWLTQSQALRSRGGVCSPKVFWQCALFFEESFKCVFFENIKSEIVNIQ